jgi:hypothetical protein
MRRAGTARLDDLRAPARLAQLQEGGVSGEVGKDPELLAPVAIERALLPHAQVCSGAPGIAVAIHRASMASA